jgi:hypothetical protein
MKTAFNEVQRFSLMIRLIAAAGFAVVPVWGIVQQIILDRPFGNNPTSDTGLIIVSLFMLLMIILFFSMRLITRINQTGIEIRFIPFTRRKVKWSEVKKAEVINYGFVGGWGIRVFTRYGTVYNVGGKMGLYVELKNGKSFVAGTQKPDELKMFLEKADYSRSSVTGHRDR